MTTIRSLEYNPTILENIPEPNSWHAEYFPVAECWKELVLALFDG